MKCADCPYYIKPVDRGHAVTPGGCAAHSYNATCPRELNWDDDIEWETQDEDD